MSIATAQAIDMKIELRGLSKRAPKMFCKFDGKISDHLATHSHFVNKIKPSRKIDNRTTQRFIHRHEGLAITIDPGLVSERLDEGLAQRDRDVFNRMMIVDLQVTLASDSQIEQAVLGEEVQHVFEKRQADGNTRLPAAVEIEFDAHV